MNIVILGAGQAAASLAAKLRALGHEGGITLIGDEPIAPYQRPPLSKAYMADGNPDALILRAEAYFADKAIRYLPETQVTAIDREIAGMEGVARQRSESMAARVRRGEHDVIC